MAADHHILLRMIGEIKVSRDNLVPRSSPSRLSRSWGREGEDPGNEVGLATGLDAFLSSFSTSRRCSRNRSPSRLPVSPMYTFLQRVQVMQ